MQDFDRLDEILDACAALRRLGTSDGKRQNDVTEDALGLLTEAAELVDELPWKPWKKSQVFDRDAFLAEAADVLHFFGHLLNAHDVTSDELFDAFMAKNAVNYERLLGDY